MKNHCKSIVFSALIAAYGQVNAENEQPNILCVVCEDISPYLACYGDPVAKTPNIDNLASESIRFTSMYAPVGVCAPSRNALITGVYPTSIGANNMRTSLNPSTLPPDITPYDVVLPVGMKCYTEFLRAEGYYCTNNFKTDYQFEPPLTAWDENGEKAHWKNRPGSQPFFSIFNLEETHESRIWVNNKRPLVVDPNDIVLPPYFPDNEVVRHDMAVLYSNIFEMDQAVDRLINEVKDAGLLNNTIIIFYSDNGGPIPRGKRSLRESGTLVPFMVRFPDGYRKGEVEERLCSFVDIPATILSLAGIKTPGYMHGRAFLGKYNTKPRAYVFGARNRLDERIDKQGYAKDERFRYIKNYYPEKAEYLAVGYRLNMPMMQNIWKLHQEGKLNDVQEQWFKAPRSEEEFYDVANDPHEINNLINDPDYSSEIKRLRKAYDKWNKTYNRLWKLPETVTMNMFWPNGVQPGVAPPKISPTSKGLKVSCKTKGASFAYKINKKAESKDPWSLYTSPVLLNKGDTLTVVAVRAGFKDSQPVVYIN